MYDFCGYVTKNDVECGDGRIIRKDAFKDCDGKTVPLVYHHIHKDLNNVLGHVDLENRDDGVYGYGVFNNTPEGQRAKELVKHGDITAMSIYANRLKQQGNNVLHGLIREVSLVLAGCNPGAKIEQVSIAHDDGSYTELPDEAIVYSGMDFDEGLAHADKDEETEESEQKQEAEEQEAENEEEDEEMAHSAERTVGDVLKTLNEEQTNVLKFLLGVVAEGEVDDEDVEHSDEGELEMHHNIFENEANQEDTLSHDDMNAILAEAPRIGNLKDAFLEHGIENLDILFPEARALDNTPTFIQRETGWVNELWNALRKTPFSRIKSRAANITEYEARARGYIKGNQKIEEVFSLLARVTTPTTVYKLQKLDRDDIVDITDMDVVAWMKQEMRGQLEEELAGAVLVGDGRPANDVSHINQLNIRPVYLDDDMYCIHKKVTVGSSVTHAQLADILIETVLLSRKDYKGSGDPWMFATNDIITRMLLAKDQIGRRLYNNLTDLATALRVARIVEVPRLEGVTRTATITQENGSTTTETRKLLALIFNPRDYVVGADKGGAVTMFDDFNLDFNKYEYLIETRCSGALADPYTAIAIETTSDLPYDFNVWPGDFTTATREKDANGWPAGYPRYGETGDTGDTGTSGEG